MINRTFISSVALAVALASPLLIAHGQAPTAAPKAELVTGSWAVDPVHTDVGFTIPHLVVSKVRGRFTQFEGKVVADGKKPENSSVNFTIKTDSIDTGNPQRDGHLKSPDFFDVAKYPEITFKSTKVSRRKNGYAALGTLTIHGISKPVVLPFTASGPVKGPDGALHAGVETAITINRQDYGLTWSKAVEGTAMVGNEVNIAINLELVKAKQTAQK